jgi:hypothetical protein
VGDEAETAAIREGVKGLLHPEPLPRRERKQVTLVDANPIF